MRTAMIGLGLLALTGCAAVSTVHKAAADVLMPPSEEATLGRKLAIEVQNAKETKLLENPEVVTYVKTVGQRVAARAENPDKWRFSFYVIDDPKTVNAFAIPGAHIYVYSGLLKSMKDEAELAGVLAHEVAHVTNRHIAKRMVAANGLQAVSDLALGTNPGEISKLATSILTQGALLKNSRVDENEADAEGIVIASKAGYAPAGLIDFLKVLKEMEGNTPDILSFLSDHPSSADRVQSLEGQIRTNRLGGTNRNPEAFAAMKSKL